MCLITLQKKPFIAEKDITVYKILTKKLCSNYFGTYRYSLDKLNETTIKKSDDFTTFDTIDSNTIRDEIRLKFSNNEIYVDRRKWYQYGYISYGQGYHSALKKSRLATGYGEVLVKGVIPKGSKYYTNPSGLVVSDKLIIKKVY